MGAASVRLKQIALAPRRSAVDCEARSGRRDQVTCRTRIACFGRKMKYSNRPQATSREIQLWSRGLGEARRP